MNNIKVLIADDHTLVREGIKNILEEARDINVVAEASNGREAIVKTKNTCPDVVILDISMPVMDGLDTCKQLIELYPDIKILILTMYPENIYAIRLLNAGALGYITKRIGAKELHEAVRTVSKGNIYLSSSSKDQILYSLLKQKVKVVSIEALSDREIQVFYLLAQGAKIKEVAENLCISVKTVENHRTHILYKLNLKRTVDLVSYAHQHKLIQIME